MMNNITPKHNIQIVVAVDEVGGFAKDGEIPWHVPEDMARFKQITSGGVCVMGRGTYNNMTSIPDPQVEQSENALVAPILPNRDSFVITSDVTKLTPGATTAPSLSYVLNQLYENDDTRPVFVLGGYRLFVEALGYDDVLVNMAIIKGEPKDCDQLFPVEVLNKFFRIRSGDITKGCYHVVYERIPQRRGPTQEEIYEAFGINGVNVIFRR